MRLKLFYPIFFCLIVQSCSEKDVAIDYSWLKNEKLSDEKDSVSPNILLINVDDLGWKDLGFLGSDYYESPALDMLAENGVTFPNGYAAAANCAPSRASLLTGLYTTKHGIYTVGTADSGKVENRKLMSSFSKSWLDSNSVTISKELQANNYNTYMVGKWHLSKTPLDFGFDVAVGGNEKGRVLSYYPPYGNIEVACDSNEHLTDALTRHALNYISKKNEPFFMYYAPYAVHSPVESDPALNLKYKWKRGNDCHNKYEYASIIENTDQNIGKLLAKLEETNLLNNTLIIFTSDNGGACQYTCQKPLRYGKGSYFEGGIRSPYIFYWKGKFLQNERSEPIINMDIYPTILSALNIENENLDGLNLLPSLRNERNLKSRPIFWHYPIYLAADKYSEKFNEDSLYRTRPGSGVRYGDWKLMRNYEDSSIVLYNLKEDISEKNDLSESNQQVVLKMNRMLDSFLLKSKVAIPSRLNPEYRKKTIK